MNRALSIAIALSLASLASCSGNSSTPPPLPITNFPPPSHTIAVPTGVSATSGYAVSVFAAPPAGSSKPDSVVQVGSSVFVGFGDDVNPDGTAGPSGKTQTEVAQYDVRGNLVKVFSVIGHNDGLMAFDANTVWAMSNEDGNPKLITINVATGAQTTYSAQPSLLTGSALPHGGGLDDMQLIGGKVYVSASNPATPTGTCPANSSTPGCPNGINSGSVVYTLSLNGDGATFNLSAVGSSEVSATNLATNTTATLNMTDPDSEAVSPDGSTLLVDSQQDSELVFYQNIASGTPTVAYLPIGGGSVQIDDTRFAPAKQAYLLLTDTPANTIYRIDATFNAGDAYSAGPPALYKLSQTSGALTPVVSGLSSPHGLLFVTP